MKISLAEERNGHQQAEQVFESASVEVGRDANECQIVFDAETWPMVSRRHAAFRVANGRCLLLDTNSCFGTFLDGHQIVEPVEIRVGSRAQFGPGGHYRPDRRDDYRLTVAGYRLSKGLSTDDADSKNECVKKREIV